MYKSGLWVIWGDMQFQILLEYDDEFVYLVVGKDSCQLVHVSELHVVH